MKTRDDWVDELIDAVDDPEYGDMFRDDDSQTAYDDWELHGRVSDIETGGPGTITRISRWAKLPDSYSATNPDDETKVFGRLEDAEDFASGGSTHD